MTQRSDVQAFLDAHPFSAYQWRIFLLCFTIVLLDGFDTGSIGFIAPSLLGGWKLTKADLAPVLSAGLFGLAAGALVAGPLADRLGRKMVLTVSVLLFGGASLLSAMSENLTQLTIYRVITGVGLGAAMPNAVTLMSEFCPGPRRATLTNAMFCGFPLGAALGGFLSAWMIPKFGWQSVLVLGGIAPLVLGVLLFLLLPESVRYLLASKAPIEKIRKVLANIDPSASRIEAFTTAEIEQKSGVGIVLSGRYLLGSLMLWVAYFMGLVIFYSMINWLPILLREGGLSPESAARISALFALGGLGAVFAGVLMDKFQPTRIVAVLFALTAVCIYALGHAAGNAGMLVGVVLVAGLVMNTAQSSLPTLAAAFYPTQGRATGVAWMMGVGRFGGMAGTFLVGELTRRQLGLGAVFAAMAVPGLIAAVALLVKAAASGRKDATALVRNAVAGEDGSAVGP